MARIESKSSRSRSNEHCFTVRGQRLSLNRKQVIAKLKAIEPGATTEHVVEVEGIWYPVKKALAAVTGLDVLRFQTAQALTIFEKLGFKVERVSNQRK